MGPKIWNSLPEDVKDLTSLQVFTEFIKTWYRSECKYNICKYSGNPYHYIWTSDLTWISLSGNLIPNVNKQNIKRNEAVVFWCVYSWFWVSTHPLGFIFFIFCLFFWSRIDPFNSSFYCTKFDFPFRFYGCIRG